MLVWYAAWWTVESLSVWCHVLWVVLRKCQYDVMSCGLCWKNVSMMSCLVDCWVTVSMMSCLVGCVEPMKNYWFCFLARKRGKCQVIADVNSRDPAARLFVHTEVEKKNWTRRGCVWCMGTSSEQVASFAWRVGHTRVIIWRFWPLFSLILQTGLAQSCWHF